MLAALGGVILPVVLVAGLGALLGWRFPLSQDTLIKVQFYGLTPALALSSLLRTTVSAEETLQLTAGYLLGSVVLAGLAWVASLRMSARSIRSVVACSIIGNHGNFGLPVALLALGQPGLDQAVVIFVASLVLMWTVGPALLASHTRFVDMAWHIVRLPVIWSMVLALVLRVLHLELPVGIATAVDMVGQAAIPMMLISLGIQLVDSPRFSFSRTLVTAVTMRVLVGPVVGFFVGRLLGLNGITLASLVLAFAMPTAVNVFMQAREYDSDADTIAAIVSVSSLVAVMTMSIAVANLGLLK